MPLTLNNCKKHGGHVEDKCPQCVADRYAQAVAHSNDFFRLCGRSKIELSSGTEIRVEELYQHFKIRMLEEMNEE